MSTQQVMRITKWLALALALLALSFGGPTSADDNVTALRNKYDNPAPQLKSNVFHPPIHLDLDSEETADTLKGDIYAVVDYPFAIVNGAFNDPRQGPANWREVLMLPFAVKEPGVFGVMAPAKGA